MSQTTPIGVVQDLIDILHNAKCINPDESRNLKNTDLRSQARNRAYIRMWEDIYRSLMRTGDFEKYNLGLDEVDKLAIKTYFKLDEESQSPFRLITVGFDAETYYEWDSWYLARAHKAMQKCYIGKYWYVFEEGDPNHPHPHFHFLVQIVTKWKAPSEIIREFASTFSVDRNYVDVESISKHQAMTDTLRYIRKTGKDNVITNVPKIEKTEKISDDQQ